MKQLQQIIISSLQRALYLGSLAFGVMTIHYLGTAEADAHSIQQAWELMGYTTLGFFFYFVIASRAELQAIVNQIGSIFSLLRRNRKHLYNVEWTYQRGNIIITEADLTPKSLIKASPTSMAVYSTTQNSALAKAKSILSKNEGIPNERILVKL